MPEKDTLDNRNMHEISRDTCCYKLGGRNVLFNQASRRLFVLNQTGSNIWDRLVAGDRCSTIVAEISKAAQVRADVIERDIAGILAAWEDNGLIGARTPPIPESATDAADGQRRTPHLGAAVSSPRGLHRRCYRLIDCEFELAAEPSIFEQCDQLLSHLRCSPSPSGRVSHVVLTASDYGWDLAIDGQLVANCANADEIVPMLHANSFIQAYRSSTAIAVIHAAAVAKGDECVLLPAGSGSGKSTLAAALVAAGLTYCTDDVAVLARDSLRLRPAPIRLGIKRGSWQVLRDRFPGLEDLPTYRRTDKKLVKYLLPAVAQLPASADCTYSISTIVFPRYAENANTTLRPIERADALLKMTDAGYDLPMTVDTASIDKLIAWLREIDCYELSFSNLDDAVEAVSSVITS